MKRMFVGFCSLPLICCGLSLPIAAAQTPVADQAAREIATRLATHYDQIETIQLRFSMSVRFQFRPSDNPGFDDYDLKDAFYACDVAANKQYLDCIDTREGPAARKRAAQRPGLYRELVQTSDASPRGAVMDGKPQVWHFEGPQGFLQMQFVSACRKNLEQGNCRVYYSNGAGSDPEVWVSFGPKPFDEMVEEFYLKFTLDAQRDFAPVSVNRYQSGKLVQRTTLEPFEVEPGIWLPERGLISTRTVSAEGIDPEREFIRSTFAIERDSIRINEPIPASRFEISFPPGTRVNDVLDMRIYTVGLKPGQATEERVVGNAEHARHIAPVNTEQGEETKTIPVGTVRADYGTPWYARVWFWTLAGSVLAAVVAGFLFHARRG